MGDGPPTIVEAERRLARLAQLLTENDAARTAAETRIVDELVAELGQADLRAYATNIINSDAEKRLLQLERRRHSLTRAQQHLHRHMAGIRRAMAIRSQGGGTTP